MTAQRAGKCTNYSSCRLAYRNEKIVVTTKEFRCPDCGASLKKSGTGTETKLFSAAVVGAGPVILFAAGIVLSTTLSPRKRIVVEQSVEMPSSITVPAPAPQPIEAAVTVAQPGNVATVAPEPPPTPNPVAAPTPDPERDQLRATVFKRIDLIPNMPDTAKDKLHNAVLQAKSLGLMLTVSFETGRTILGPQDLAGIRRQVAQPAIKDQLEDPAVVLIILGFADKQGPEPKNQDLSMARAESVMKALRDECGVRNVMHVVPMGGTAIFDPHDYAKNRVAEVWAGKP